MASHLLPALCKAGHKIVQVISRSIVSAQSLAEPLGAQYSSSVISLNPDIDLLFLIVPDDVLPDIINEISWFRGIVVHTSGSLPLSSFNSVNYPNGILYPLQTFTKHRQLDFRSIPIFIEGSNETVLTLLREVSEQISNEVYELGSEQRAHLHLAAVFANNFTNYLFTAADEVLRTAGIERGVLNSLIRETLEKAIDPGPVTSQTGPAIRGDIATLKKHLNLLSFSTELREVYQCLTTSIQNYYSIRSGDK